MLKANEVKITITVANRSFNKIIFGPLLVGEVVRTINIPATGDEDKSYFYNTFIGIPLYLSIRPRDIILSKGSKSP